MWFLATGTDSAWDWQLRTLDRAAITADFSQRLRLGQTAILFRERLENLAIASPWYYFQGGLVVRSAGGTWRFSFGPPAGSATDDVGAELGAVRTMRRTGKRWLEVFEQARATP